MNMLWMLWSLAGGRRPTLIQLKVQMLLWNRAGKTIFQERRARCCKARWKWQCSHENRTQKLIYLLVQAQLCVILMLFCCRSALTKDLSALVTTSQHKTAKVIINISIITIIASFRPSDTQNLAPSSSVKKSRAGGNARWFLSMYLGRWMKRSLRNFSFYLIMISRCTGLFCFVLRLFIFCLQKKRLDCNVFRFSGVKS